MGLRLGTTCLSSESHTQRRLNIPGLPRGWGGQEAASSGAESLGQRARALGGLELSRSPHTCVQPVAAFLTAKQQWTGDEMGIGNGLHTPA